MAKVFLVHSVFFTGHVYTLQYWRMKTTQLLVIFLCWTDRESGMNSQLYRDVLYIHLIRHQMVATHTQSKTKTKKKYTRYRMKHNTTLRRTHARAVSFCPAGNMNSNTTLRIHWTQCTILRDCGAIRHITGCDNKVGRQWLDHGTSNNRIMLTG